MKKKQPIEIAVAARAVRAKVKRELTDREVDEAKRDGRLLETARRFRSTLTILAAPPRAHGRNRR